MILININLNKLIFVDVADLRHAKIKHSDYMKGKYMLYLTGLLALYSIRIIVTEITRCNYV